MRHWRTGGFLALMVALAGVVTPAFAGFGNTTNTPFLTRCNGPQGAIVVEHNPGFVQPAAQGMAVYASHGVTRLQAAAASVRRLERYGLVGSQAQNRVRFPRTLVHTTNGQMIRPNLMTTAQTGGLGDAGNQVTFTYEGWSDGDRAALQSYLTTAMPKIRSIYGPPAFNLTVTIIQDNTLQTLQGGTYDVSTNEIRIPPLSGNFPEDTYVLLMLVLNAFHDDALLFYDAWEQGFIGAAAYVIQTQPGVSPGYDPIDPGPFYCLSVYECENQPELGNSTFYPASGGTNMLVWRIAMARAAWLKCWIENPQFFASFNQRYYAAYNTALPGDIPTLRELAAQVVPTVEGLPFAEWYQRQYVLDTSVRLGAKLYTWNIPLTDAVGLIAELYETLADGDEVPVGGQARTTYWDYQHSLELYAEEGNLIDIPPGGSTPGEGFLLPTFFNIGGPQRIGVQIDVAGLRREYPFAYGVRGFDPGENNLYGAILGNNTGTVDVLGGAGLTDVEVDRGVWGDRLTAGGLSPLQATVTFKLASGETTTRRFNIGWDSYCCFLQAGAQATQAHTFAYGLTGLHLMSLPLTPTVPDAATVLGLPADQLLMARWDPRLAGDQKYLLWPSFVFDNPGAGYWLRVPADTTVNLQGALTATDQAWELPLYAGWNLIGSPRLDDVTVTDLQVRAGDTAPVSWDTAVTNRLVQRGIFGYGQTSGYELTDAVSPWNGYWVRCLEPKGVSLIFPVVATTSAASADAAAPRLQGARASSGLKWRLPLVVSAGPLRSAAAYLGTAAGASLGADQFDVAAPPSFGDYVQARFRHADWGRDAGAYVADIRPAGVGTQRWEVQVACTLASTAVTVTWPDLSALPTAVRPVLADPTTGRRLYMRTTTGYTFRTTARGSTRDLVIEVADAQAPLAITSLAITSGRRIATMSYRLSADAAVTARIINLAGRPVRVLARDLVQSSGQQLLQWNGLNDAGTAAPPGYYLLELRARTDTGQEARALGTVNYFATRR